MFVSADVVVNDCSCIMAIEVITQKLIICDQFSHHFTTIFSQESFNRLIITMSLLKLSLITVRRALPWPPDKVSLQIVRQSGCVNLIDSDASLQSSHCCNLITIAWVFELTYLYVIFKCENLLGVQGKKARCTVSPFLNFCCLTQ